ncbi:MAG: hypothetical protein JWM48_2362 [Mycobacterium sp.]|nr:hypothetical protein [Mycobacterium sp.]
MFGRRRGGRRDGASYRVTALAAGRRGGLSVGQLVTAACGYAEALLAVPPGELAGGVPARALRVAAGRPVLALGGRGPRGGPVEPSLGQVTRHLIGLLAGPDARSPAGVAVTALLEDCGAPRLRGAPVPPLAEQVATFRGRVLAVAPPAALPAAAAPVPPVRYRRAAVLAGLLLVVTVAGVVAVVLGAGGGSPDWSGVVARVDTCRGAAFAAPRADVLAGCDLPGSAADRADRARVAQLVAAGLHAGPLRQQHTAVRLLAPPAATSARLATTAAADAYDLLDTAGRVVAHHAAGPPTPEILELGRVAPGGPWRLVASRAG